VFFLFFLTMDKKNDYIVIYHQSYKKIILEVFITNNREKKTILIKFNNRQKNYYKYVLLYVFICNRYEQKLSENLLNTVK